LCSSGYFKAGKYGVNQLMILVTGGAGYIGSHTCLALLDEGYDIVVLDNFSNSSVEALLRVKRLTGKDFPIITGDIKNRQDIDTVFSTYKITSVIHFAGLKAVGESVDKPLHYYENNVLGTVNLCRVMAKYRCKKIVFSSSATVYGDPDSVPITEKFPLSATNPYGRSKLMVEDILRDVFVSDSDWSIALLRYFNPVGAHESGNIGEDPSGIPNNLMPYIAQVAVGKRPYLNVFGGDYATHDGTGVRDYIHVTDLAKGHVKAIDVLTEPQVLTVNLGTGVGYSVLDMVAAFEKAAARPVPYKIIERRSGDVAACYADPDLAFEKLNWQAEYGIDRMCEDTWRWQSMNPHGYESE
jgi:UDP-glucose 4-epimerase